MASQNEQETKTEATSGFNKEAYEDALNCFTGTEQWYKVNHTRVVLTDGSYYVIKTLGIQWFIGAMNALSQHDNIKPERFTVWKLFKKDGKLQGQIEDGNYNVLHTIEVDPNFHHPDELPVDEVVLWSDGKVFYLPSEH